MRQFLKRLLPPRSAEERALRQLLAVKLKPVDIAIDCGANVGSITQHLARTGATVYAFEPNPFAFKVLHQRFADNQNVHCIPKGVDQQADTLRLYLHENSDQDEVQWSAGSSLLQFKGNVSAEKYVEVEVIDLCDFIDSLDRRVRLLKMDIEGVEARILTKLIETNTIHKIDHVFVEVHDHRISELKPAMNRVRELIQKNEIKHINLDWF